jgi:hypothetical protein
MKRVFLRQFSASLLGINGTDFSFEVGSENRDYKQRKNCKLHARKWMYHAAIRLPEIVSLVPALCQQPLASIGTWASSRAEKWFSKGKIKAKSAKLLLYKSYHLWIWVLRDIPTSSQREGLPRFWHSMN